MNRTIAPRLSTARLELRQPEIGDFEHIARFYASDRSVLEGGPLDRIDAWRIFASDVGQWPLMDYGPFSVMMQGRYVGEVDIYHAAEFPEPELGWFVIPVAEGQGIAAEAAQAVKAWARATFGWTRLVSIIDPGNARSIATGLRIGGVIDPSLSGIDPGDVVIRHDLAGTRA